ncbi:hypothetical protein Tco_1421301, partial [Tanacetum coccineum]
KETDDEETDDKFVRGDEYVQENVDEEIKDAEVDVTRSGDKQMTDTTKADAEKSEEVKDDNKKAELPPSSSSLFVSSDPLLAIIQRVSVLEKDVQELKEVNHTTIYLALLRSEIPSTINAYLGSSLGDTLQKVLQRYIEELKQQYSQQVNYKDAIEESVQANIINDVKNLLPKKRDHDGDDKDEDPSAGPNQGKKTKRRRTKESKSTKKTSTTKETSKGNSLTKGSKSDKSVHTEESVVEPTEEVIMDASNDDVVNDADQPQNNPAPKHNCKPIPLKGHLGHLTVASEYFFNNDLGYLKSSDPEKKYTTSIIKMKVARYELVGIEDMIPSLWSVTKVGYDKDAKRGIKHWGPKRKLFYKSQLNRFSKHDVYSHLKILSVKSMKFNKLHGYSYLEEIMMRRLDRQLYKFKEGNFVNLHLNDIEDMLLLVVQHKLFQLDGSDIVDLAVALRMFTRSLIIKRRVEDVQLGVERVVYEDLNKRKRVMRADELYKFSDGTLKLVRDELHHRILNFCLGYKKEMCRRKWSATDKRRLELMVELIDKQIQERRIIRNLERLVGARELEMDYRPMQRTI